MASPGYPDGLGLQRKFAKKKGPEHEEEYLIEQPQLKWSEGGGPEALRPIFRQLLPIKVPI